MKQLLTTVVYRESGMLIQLGKKPTQTKPVNQTTSNKQQQQKQQKYSAELFK